MYEAYKKKILSFYERRKRMPSYAEIMELTGFRSKNAVFKLVEKLVEDGVVDKDQQGKLTPRTLQKSVEGIPLLGLVEAGFPSAAEEELLDVMNFDEYLVPNKEASYILKVKGDSMIDAGIREGDMVIVERKATYKPGQIVIAMVDGEYTMKYLRKKGEKYFLEPANEKYKPIYPSEAFRVEAVVTAVVRKY
ncbi:MAG: transcriptional repressor LexA [Candidatus Pacebacteria bacterium]|nr:transcriptional repressor LexA [Candidatus Paceibacterota bacterium]